MRPESSEVVSLPLEAHQNLTKGNTSCSRRSVGPITATPPTTSGVLFPWQMSANLGVRGPCLGVDWGSDAPWCYDAFELYTRGVLTNANMVVAGEPGSGKSAAVKTYLYRTLALYGAGGVRRWAAIVDPKREYLALAAALGHVGARALSGRPQPAQPARRRARVGRVGPRRAGAPADRTGARPAWRSCCTGRSPGSKRGRSPGRSICSTTAGSQPSLHDVFRGAGRSAR